MSTPPILVTGATGTVGWHVALGLADRDVDAACHCPLNESFYTSIDIPATIHGPEETLAG